MVLGKVSERSIRWLSDMFLFLCVIHSAFWIALVFSSFACVYACCFVCAAWSRCMV